MSEPEPTQVPPIEPSANLRQFASFSAEMYVSLVQAGFSGPQALYLVGQWIGAATTNKST